MGGIYYDPQVHNYGGAFVNGLSKGISTALSMKQFESSMKDAELERQRTGLANQAQQMEIDRQKNIEGANKDISDLWTKLGMGGGSQPATQQPGQPESGTSPVPATGLAGIAANQGSGAPAGESEKTGSSPGSSSDKLAEFTKGMYGIYMKRNLPAMAQSVVDHEYNIAKNMAATIGPEAGLSFLKKSSQGDMWADAKVAKAKGHGFELSNFGPNKDGIAVFNKDDGSLTITQQPTAKKEDAPKAPTTRTVMKGEQEVQQEWDAKTNTWKEVGSGPRFKNSDDGEGKKVKVGERNIARDLIDRAFLQSFGTTTDPDTGEQKFMTINQLMTKLKGIPTAENTTYSQADAYNFMRTRVADYIDKGLNPEASADKAKSDWAAEAPGLVKRKPGGAKSSARPEGGVRKDLGSGDKKQSGKKMVFEGYDEDTNSVIVDGQPYKVNSNGEVKIGGRTYIFKKEPIGSKDGQGRGVSGSY